MPHVDKHAPGSFAWIELATSDQNAAKHFYTSLFGWSFFDSPMGPDQFYTMFQLEGRQAAAAYALGAEQKAMHVPPNWMLYVASENADEAAKRTVDAGGTVLAGPLDVYDFGRMVVLRDPTGAAVSVWQPKTHPGITITGVDGTLCWADLSSPDPARAKDFYSDVFGWNITTENDPSGYLHIKNGEEFIGGIQAASMRNPNVPPHWLAYFLVSDCDGSAAKAKELGGSHIVPPMTLEKVGRFAVIADPQGAVFAIFQPPAHA